MPEKYLEANAILVVHVIVIYTQGFFRAIDPCTVVMIGVLMQTILLLVIAAYQGRQADS